MYKCFYEKKQHEHSFTVKQSNIEFALGHIKSTNLYCSYDEICITDNPSARKVLLLRNTKRMIVGDNVASHLSPKVIEFCRQKNLYMTPLRPNATHSMQPLDVVVFGAMKKTWR